MPKKSSLFKVMTTILTATALTLSVATGVVIGKAFQRYNKMSQKDAGKSKGIKSIVKTGTYGLVDEYTITYDDDTTSTFIVTNGANGVRGIQGYPGEDGHTPEINIGNNGHWFVDGVDTGISARGENGLPGNDGRGIQSIEKTDTNGLIDTYTITYTDGTTSTFIVVNGQDGPRGAQGIPGDDGYTPVVSIGSSGNWVVDGVDTGISARGPAGENGNGIESIVKTATNGLIDTYTITYTDGTTSTFVVVNGQDGQRGPQGLPGDDGHTPVVTIGENGNWFVDGTDTGVSARGQQGEVGETGENGNSVITGSGAPLNTLGRDGDTYIDLDSWYVFVKEDGAWVVKGNIRGAAGETGNAGTNGNTVLVGNSDPLPTLGTDGDSYINLVTFDFYVKEDGNWVNKGNIKGNDGDNGATGVNGNTLLTGNGAPANTDGQNGDSYIDYETWNIYLKQEGTWVQTGNIKGADGITIVSVEKTGSEENVDTYTITLSNGNTITFTVTNGINGHTPVIAIGENGNWFVDGVDTGVKATGNAGTNGADGANGNAIESIVQTGSEGLVDTYTITFTNGDTFTYTVTNGADGKDGTSIRTGNGVPHVSLGSDGDSYINLDNWDYYVKEDGAWVLKGNIRGNTGATGASGNDGADGNTVLTGTGAPANDLGNQGDVYVNTNTWDVYVKTSTGWGSPIDNIKGSGLTVTSVELTNTEGNVDTYTITFSDGTTATFVVTNGVNGEDGNNGLDGAKLITGTGEPANDLGNQGDSYIDVSTWTLYVKTSTGWDNKGSFKGNNGANGADGNDGVSVVSIVLTSSADNVDTYTITYSDASTSTFTVTNGINGANGSSLLTGAVDPTTEGVDGDSYLNTTTWEYFVKENGTWVSKGHINGVDGADGVDGIDGNTISVGAGEPDNEDGKNGDSYIDLDTWNFYVKEAGEWVEKGNIHEELDKFTISFDTDEGSANPEDQVIEKGFTVEQPVDPTKEGWIFQGWFTPDGNRWNFDKDVVSSDITLIAHWAKFRVVDGVLVECTATGDVTIPEFFNGQLVQTIGAEVFKDAPITSVNIPHTVKRIEHNAFEGCAGMLSVVIPGNVKDIEEEAFKDCTNVAYFYLAEGIETFGDRCFNGCNNLRALTIPNSAKSLGQGMLSTVKGWKVMDNLKTLCGSDGPITVGELEPADANIGDIFFNRYSCELFVKTADGWNLVKVIDYLYDPVLGTEVPTDPESAEFNHCFLNTETGEVYINDGTKLTSLTLPFVAGTLEGDNAFLGYLFGADDATENPNIIPTSLTNVTITGDAPIASTAMNDVRFVKVISILGMPEYVDFGAFKGCISLETMTIPFVGREVESSFNVFTYGNGAPADDLACLIYIDVANNVLYMNQPGTGWVGEPIPPEIFLVGHGAPTSPVDGDMMEYIDLDNGDLYVGMNGQWQKMLNIIDDISVIMPGAYIPESNFFAYVFGSHLPTEGVVPDSLSKVIVTGGNGAKRDYLPSTAFKGADKIKEIILPEGLKKIGDEAFSWDDGLLRISIPDSVETIGAKAFYQCTNLTQITLPSHLKTINTLAFGNCYKLTSIVVPEGAIGIQDEAFFSCSQLKYVYLPSTLQFIGEGVFHSCIALENVVIPDNIQTVGISLLEGCTNLKSLTLPFIGGDKNGNGGFRSLNKYFNDHYPNEGMTVILTRPYGPYDDSLLSGAFESAFYVKTVVLPDGITYIGQSAFRDSGIQNLVVPGTVEEFGSWAFAECSELISLVIEDGAPKTFATEIFRGCSNLNYLYIGGPIIEFYNPSTQFAYTNNLEYIYLGRGLETLPEYLLKNITSLKTLVLGEDFKAIGDEALSGCTALENVYLPATVEIIGKKAFYGCTSLKNISIPQNLIKIDDEAFFGCTSLTSVVFNEGLEVVGNHAFDGCTSLRYVFTHEGITTLGFYAFKDTAITSFVIPESILYTGMGLFNGCELVSLTLPYNAPYKEFQQVGTCYYSTLPDSWGEDGDIVFYAIPSDGYVYYKVNGHWEKIYRLTDETGDIFGITYGNGEPTTEYYSLHIDLLTGDMYRHNSTGAPWYKIGNIADPLCSMNYLFGETISENGIYTNINFVPESLKTVVITQGNYDSDSDTYYIPDLVFNNCEKIENIILPNQIESIGNKTFRNCKSLTYIILPEQLKHIGEEAFYDCSSIKNIVVPDGCLTIGKLAFAGCGCLETIRIPNTVTSIGKGALRGQVELVYKDTILNLINELHPELTPRTGIIYYTTEGSGPAFTETEYSINISTGMIWTRDNGSSKHVGWLSTLIMPQGMTWSSGFDEEIMYTKGMYLDIQTGSVYDVQYSVSNLTTIELPFVGGSATGVDDQYFNYIFEAKDGDVRNGYAPEGLKTVILTGFNGEDLSYSNIPVEAFMGSNIENIYMNTFAIVTISERAFKDCTNLKIISLPTYTVYIEEEAFANCTSLESFDAAAGLMDIADRAFYNCTSMKYFHFNLDESVETLAFIGNEAFANCTSLQAFSVPYSEDFCNIGDRAFANCTSLKSFSLETFKYNTYTKNDNLFGESVFYNCTSLETLIVPTLGAHHIEVTSARYKNGDPDVADGYDPFIYYINVDTGYLFYYDGVSFRKICNIKPYETSNIVVLSSEIASAVDGDVHFDIDRCIFQVKENGEWVAYDIVDRYLGYFFDSSILDNSSCPESLKTVIIKQIDVEGNIRNIYSSWFKDCQYLQTVVLPESTNQIGCYAFANSNVKTVIIGDGYATNLQRIDAYAFENSKITNFDLESGEFVRIDDYAFNNCDKFRFDNEITVERVGNYAFANCKLITGISLVNCEEIGEYAFMSCIRLEGFNNDAFAVAGGTVIKTGAFKNCRALYNLNLDQVVSLGSYAFSGCTSLVNFDSGSRMTTIGDYAFENCYSLSHAMLLSSISEIGSGAFINCYNLKVIEFATSNLTTVASNAFDNCYSIQAVYSTLTYDNWKSVVFDSLGSNSQSCFVGAKFYRAGAAAIVITA